MTDAINDAVLKNLQRLLRDRWKRMERQTAKVLEQAGPEPVHALRVTTRRLQELLELAQEVLRKPPHSNSIRALRQARRVCDTVRNLDVLHGLIEQRQRRAGETTLWQAIAEDVAKQRTREEAKMRRSLERLDLPALHTRWRSALKRWPQEDPKAEERVQGHLVSHILKRHEQFIRARGAALSGVAHTRETHTLRLAGKRLRYALEALSDLGNEAAKASVTRLRRFQVALGEWHDCEMLAELIIERCARKKFLRREPDFALRLLQALHRVRNQQATKLRRALTLAGEIEALDEVFGPEVLSPLPEVEANAA